MFIYTIKSIPNYNLLRKKCVFVATLFTVHCLCCKADTVTIQYSHNNPSSRLYLPKNTNEKQGWDYPEWPTRISDYPFPLLPESRRNQPLKRCGFFKPEMLKIPKILVTVLNVYRPQNPLKFKRWNAVGSNFFFLSILIIFFLWFGL